MAVPLNYIDSATFAPVSNFFTALLQKVTPSAYDTTPFREWLAAVPVSSLSRRREFLDRVVVVQDGDTVLKALGVLVETRIVAAPVFSAARNQYVGFFSLNDAVAAITSIAENSLSLRELGQTLVDSFHRESSRTDVTKLLSDESLLAQTLVADVANLSERNPFVSLAHTASVLDAIVLLSSSSASRLAVVNADGGLVDIVTPSQIIQFLRAALPNHKELAEASLKQLRVEEIPFNVDAPADKRSVVFVRPAHTALEAFTLLGEKRISGAPVVDDNGKLVGEISVRDLRLLKGEAAFSVLFLSVHDWLEEVKKLPVRGLKPDLGALHYSSSNSLLAVCETFHGYRVQRLYTSNALTGKLQGLLPVMHLLTALTGDAAAAPK